MNEAVLMRWIPVDEKLPSESKVIVKYAYGVGEAVFIDGSFRTICDWDTELPEVTHWMSLPRR